MDRWEGKVAVITGAGGGIGFAIAEKLMKAGVSVVGLDNRLEGLDKLSALSKKFKGRFYARQCDISKDEELLSAFKWVNVELGGVDILVNNAGTVTNEKLIDDDIESFRRMLDVNVLAYAVSIREAIASMKSRDVAGYIINMNSIAGHFVLSSGPTYSLYAATKHAVTALTETVRRELIIEANHKIRITSISPGTVNTGMLKSAVIDVESWLKENPHINPEDIGDAVIYLLGTRNQVNVTELTIRPTGCPY